MTAVEGWFSDKMLNGTDIKKFESLSKESLELVSENIAINRSCDVHFKDDEVWLTALKHCFLWPTFGSILECMRVQKVLHK